MKGVFQQISKTLPADNNRQKFMESINQSRDIYALLIDTSLVDKLDHIGGPVKLAMTVIGKYFESMI